MKFMKKVAKFLVVTMAVLQAAAPSAAAAGASVSGYSDHGKNVILDYSSGLSGQSDFVTQFPVIDVQAVPKNGRPSPELANQERKEFVSIPLYYQTDYPDVLYGAGTISTSGCGITSMAMIASYLTGYAYTPDELAYYFGGRAENNITRMECAADTLGIPYEKPVNWHHTYEALQQGKCAIILVQSPSEFTQGQHFIVLTGLTEDGKILVNDSYAPNYDKWNLKDGFANGFSESQIVQGYQGAWVFDKSAMPEEITRYTEQLPETVESRYPDIDLTFAERQLLARVVWVEARGESAEGQQAVAEVVFNRLMSDGFPNNLRDVIYGENQFRSVKFLDDAEPGQAQYRAIENALYGPYVLPTDVTYFARFATNNNIWGTIGGHIFCYEHPKADTVEEKIN